MLPATTNPYWINPYQLGSANKMSDFLNTQSNIQQETTISCLSNITSSTWNNNTYQREIRVLNLVKKIMTTYTGETEDDLDETRYRVRQCQDVQKILNYEIMQYIDLQLEGQALFWARSQRQGWTSIKDARHSFNQQYRTIK